MWLPAELRHAARSVLAARGFSLAFVLTLGLGLGANAAIFTVVRGVFLRPLPNLDEDRIVYVRQSAPGLGVENAYFSVPEIRDYRARARTIAAFAEFSTIGFTMLGAGDPRQVRAGVVDGGFFEVMGLRPVLGRLLGPADDGPGAAGAAVLTHRFWTSAFGADPGVVGRSLRLGGRAATVVGVLEPAPPYPAETELIANLVTSPHHLSATMTTDREHRMTELFGRLAPAADLGAARAELRAVHAAMAAEHPEAYDESARFAADVAGLRDQITAGARTTLWLLMGTAGIVLLIACSNLANLLLARVRRREQELGVRAALGAAPANLRGVLLLECAMLCLGGAAVGAGIAALSVPPLARYAARFSVRALEIGPDTGLLGFAVGAAALAAVVFAFVPPLPSANAALGGGAARGASRSWRARRSQRALATAQIALSFVLLAGAGLLLRSLLALRSEDPGFHTGVLAVSVPLVFDGRTSEQLRATHAEIERRVATLRGVRAVALGSAIPLRDGAGVLTNVAFSAEGAAADGSGTAPRANFRSVSPGYFATLGIPILAGRPFDAADRAAGERVVIVSQSLVARLYPGRDPIGRRIAWTDERMRFGGISTEPRRIVGVADDVREMGLDRPAEMTIYHPFAQEPAGGRLFVLAAGDPRGLIAPIRRTVRDVAANQPVEVARTLAEIRAETLAPSRLNAVLVGGFAAVALAIAAVGVTGVLAYSAAGRTREFGIRLAVGAKSRDILLSVLREGAAIAAVGLALGVAGALALSHSLAALLHGTGTRDPLTFGVAAAVLLASALCAAAVPAARAAGVDPLVALRAD